MKKTEEADLSRIIGALGSGSTVSGQRLGGELGVSRAALWKKINSLRAKGYEIRAVPGKGYRLVFAPEFSSEGIRSLLKAGKGREILFLQKTKSTNELAMEIASGGAPHGSVVIADSQTGGKGRLGRKWHSPPGVNVYMSVILRPELPPRQAALLTLLSAVSSANALRKASGLEVAIKWPNDLIVGGRKLGGILLEMRSEPDRIIHAVVGIGINVNESRFPAELAETATSVFKETGSRLRRTDVAAHVVNELDAWLSVMKEKGGQAVIDEWKRLDETLGRQVRVVSGGETLAGLAEDIDGEGRLVVRTQEGKTRLISSGDVWPLRPPHSS